METVEQLIEKYEGMKNGCSPVGLLVSLGGIIAATNEQFGLAHAAMAPYAFDYLKQGKASAAKKKIESLAWVAHELTDAAQSFGHSEGVEGLVGQINAEIAELEAIAAQSKANAAAQYS
ncbi:hypothetical protein HYU10_00215 [Candidatus Woesearchaeota archaeon]|nr:hypothetical protein [Candidatus Woesearchaeota archaeon]MBI2130174.1 hypothetical protein [Candidatus Woesearchaeota archaeon]MBI2661008.1 hypothetical protein [Candidatus Woesearchaeota archaeon]